VLGAVAEWVAAEAPRSAHLPELLGLVQLAALPPEPAAAGPCLAALSTSPEGRSVMDAVARIIRGGGAPGAGAGAGASADVAAGARDAAGWPAARWPAAAGEAAARRAAAAAGAVCAGPQASAAGAPRREPGQALALGGSAAAAAAAAPEGPPPHAAASCGAAPSGGPGGSGGVSTSSGGGGEARVGARRTGIHLDGGAWPSARRRAYRPSKLLVAGGPPRGWGSGLAACAQRPSLQVARMPCARLATRSLLVPQPPTPLPASGPRPSPLPQAATTPRGAACGASRC
jgi:hypothetical protein